MLNVSSSIDQATRVSRVNATITKATEKLSSGLRVNRAADDAAGLAVSETFRTQVRGLTQAAANIQDAINIVQIGEDGIQSTLNALQDIRELIVKASNGTNSQASLQAIQIEIDEKKKLVLDAFEVAHAFRSALDPVGLRVLDFQVGANEGEELRVDYNELRTVLIDFIVPAYGYTELFNDPDAARFARGQFGDPLPPPNAPVPPPPFFPPFPPGTTFDQAFPKILLVDPNTPVNIQNSFDLIERALGDLVLEEVKLGAAHNKLEHTLSSVMAGQENQARSESQIRDADVATELTQLTKTQVIAQSAQNTIQMGAAKQSSIVTLLRGLGDQ